jgi:hypothetical protein
MNGDLDMLSTRTAAARQAELRSRLSTYDNMVVYQYISAVLEDVQRIMQSVESSVAAIR